jgi:hydrophobic/amphiphilic exporter-1 (mainly G- bacteria), HAE1 family
MSVPTSSFVTRRPVAVLMVFTALVVFGLFSYGRLPLTLMPELSYPTLTVRTEFPGAAPEEVEADVSRPLEESLGVVSGLRKISSVSRADVSDVVMEFAWDTDMSEAAQDVLERLDLVFLPDEAERPLILRFDPSLDPVMELALAGDGRRFEGEEGLRRLRRLADRWVKRRLEPIPGVAAVRVRGGLEEEVHVLVDDEALERTGLSIQTVIDRLAQENVNVAGGTLQEGRIEYMVRTVNEYRDLSQIGDTVLARVQGRDVRLSDVARVERAHKERQISTRTDGAESVQIDVFKESDANIVDLARRVRERVGTLEEPAAPGFGRGGPEEDETASLAHELLEQEGAELTVVADRSTFIESSVREVRNTAVLGGLLAVFVLFLFLLDVKATVIVALSIPMSLFLTFAPLHLLGVSLNIMSLGGLALGVGMLVDSSIVVLESITRCREEGDGIEAAAVRGTAEVRGAVVASTLTSIAVFFPMVFVEGLAGQAFGDLGLAVVISLLASLLVAVSFIPMLASRQGRDGATTGVRPRLRFHSVAAFRRDLAATRSWLKPLAVTYLALRTVVALVLELLAFLLLTLVAALAWVVRRLVAPVLGGIYRFGLRPVARRVGGGIDRLQDAYPGTLRWVLRHSGLVLAATALVLVATGWLLAALPSELLPEVHQGEVTFEVALPVGSPLEETRRVLEPVEDAILAEREHIDSLILTLGYDPAQSQRSDEGEHTARFKLLLDTADPRVESAVVERVRGRLAGLPDVDARVTRPVLFSSQTPIEVEVHGDDLRELADLSEQTRRVMAALPELADVEATLRSGAPEVQVVYDRDRLARYGLDVRAVAEQVRSQVRGTEATRYNLQDRRIPIVVRLAEDDRASVEDVAGLTVNPGGERPIPLSAVAEVRLGEGPSEVRRVDGQRVALVRANLAPRDGATLSQAAEHIRRSLDRQVEWPAGTAYFLSGQNEEWDRSRDSLWLALGLAVFLVYVIMAAQFESLTAPLVILFTIPLAFFGTALGLHLFGLSLSIVVFLGMILLAGIVVNNAIVLVDYMGTLRRRGLDRLEAVVTAGRVRLRPILMTTATTVLGLTPMALGLGDGAEIRTPMALAVISGLLTSTLLTLVVVPVVYVLFDRLRERVLGKGDRSAEARQRERDLGDAEPSPAPLAGSLAEDPT